MIKHAQKQHDIEMPQLFRGNPADIGIHVLDFRAKQIARQNQLGIPGRIQRHHFSSPPFHLETEPPVPSSDVEYPLPSQVRWDRELRQAGFEQLNALEAWNDFPARQLNAVIPAQTAEPVDLLAGFAGDRRIARLRHAPSFCHSQQETNMVWLKFNWHASPYPTRTPGGYPALHANL